MEAEYITMSMSLQEVIPMMGLLKEAHSFGINILYIVTKVLCKVFTDNSCALEMARLPKICPYMKHINQYFHHFCEYVQCREIMLHTEQQKADKLTKPNAEEPFQRHRLAAMEW